MFTTNYERLAPQIVEDTAVLVRALVLPEEGAAPKISVQDIVALDNARVDLPGVIAIRVWLGRNGAVDRAQALRGAVQEEAGGDAGAVPAGVAAGFFGAAGCAGEGASGKEFKAAVEAICGVGRDREAGGVSGLAARGKPGRNPARRPMRLL